MKILLASIMGVALAFTLNGCAVHGHGYPMHHKVHHHNVHHKVVHHRHHDGKVLHKKDVETKKVEKVGDTKVEKVEKESK